MLMRTNREPSIQVGPGLFSLLAVLFIGLKLTGYIAWSWWWVLAPLWAPAVAALLILGVIGLIALATK
jgi:fatty acid desaturase